VGDFEVATGGGFWVAAGDIQGSECCVADLDARWIGASVQFRSYSQTLFGSRIADQLDNDFVLETPSALRRIRGVRALRVSPNSHRFQREDF
jgi:hypothetical protein